MKRFSLLSVLAIAALIFQSCETPWQPLFNGENLDNWDTYVGPTEEGGDAAVTFEDSTGLYTASYLEGPTVTINGNVGWYAGDNMVSGELIIKQT